MFNAQCHAHLLAHIQQAVYTGARCHTCSHAGREAFDLQRHQVEEWYCQFLLDDALTEAGGPSLAAACCILPGDCIVAISSLLQADTAVIEHVAFPGALCGFTQRCGCCQHLRQLAWLLSKTRFHQKYSVHCRLQVSEAMFVANFAVV